MRAILLGDFWERCQWKKNEMHSISREWRGLEMSSGAEKEWVALWMSGLILNEFQPFPRPCLLSHAPSAAIFISPRSKFRSNKSVGFHSLHKAREILQKNWVCSAARCLLLLHVEIRKIRGPTSATHDAYNLAPTADQCVRCSNCKMCAHCRSFIINFLPVLKRENVCTNYFKTLILCGLNWKPCLRTFTW